MHRRFICNAIHGHCDCFGQLAVKPNNNYNNNKKWNMNIYIKQHPTTNKPWQILSREMCISTQQTGRKTFRIHSLEFY